MKLASPEIQKKWPLIQKAKNADDYSAFVDGIINSKHGFIDEFMERFVEIKTTTKEGDKGKWISFASASTQAGGDDIIFAMHKTGKLAMRAHPNLVGCEDIKFPRNQQVAYVTEYWGSETSKSETDRHKKRDDGAEAIDAFTKSHAAMTMGAPHMATSSGSMDEQPGNRRVPPPTPCARDVAVVQNIRRQHGQWDRMAREWTALVLRSEQHINTTGCKFEGDLRDAVAK